MNLSEATTQLSAYLRNESEAPEKINLACERILAFGKFRGLTKLLDLQVYSENRIVLPQDFESVLGLCNAGRSVQPRDPWFRFANGSSFCADPNWHSIDLGDGHVTFRPIAGALGLRLAGTDTAAPVSLQLRLNADQGVRASLVNFTGELGDFVTEFATAPLEEVVSFSKGRTTQPVIMEARFADAPSTWVPVGIFQPRDQDVRLRAYSVPNAQPGDRLLALCKQRYRPAVEPTDPLPIDSIYVLRLALEALSYEDAGDLAKASQYWEFCRKSLDDALSEHRNAAGRTLPIFVRAAAGKGLRAIR
jgi:hypothetical protein